MEAIVHSPYDFICVIISMGKYLNIYVSQQIYQFLVPMLQLVFTYLVSFLTEIFTTLLIWLCKKLNISCLNVAAHNIHYIWINAKLICIYSLFVILFLFYCNMCFWKFHLSFNIAILCFITFIIDKPIDLFINCLAYHSFPEATKHLGDLLSFQHWLIYYFYLTLRHTSFCDNAHKQYSPSLRTIGCFLVLSVFRHFSV